LDKEAQPSNGGAPPWFPYMSFTTYIVSILIWHTFTTIFRRRQVGCLHWKSWAIACELLGAACVPLSLRVQLSLRAKRSNPQKATQLDRDCSTYPLSSVQLCGRMQQQARSHRTQSFTECTQSFTERKPMALRARCTGRCIRQPREAPRSTCFLSVKLCVHSVKLCVRWLLCRNGTIWR
jgi:hypothetical protein